MTNKDNYNIVISQVTNQRVNFFTMPLELLKVFEKFTKSLEFRLPFNEPTVQNFILFIEKYPNHKPKEYKEGSIKDLITRKPVEIITKLSSYKNEKIKDDFIDFVFIN